MKKIVLLILMSFLLLGCELSTFHGVVLKKEVIKFGSALSASQYNISYIRLDNSVFKTKSDTVFFLYEEGSEIIVSSPYKSIANCDTLNIGLPNNGGETIQIFK